MKQFFLSLLVLCFLSLPVSQSWAADLPFAGWYEDGIGYQQALKEQEKLQKPILLYVYAPWCPYCKRVNQGLFFEPQVKTFLKSVIPVRVYPENGGKAEEKLGERLHITGYPTLFLQMPHSSKMIELDAFRASSNPQGPELKSPSEFIQLIERLESKNH